jgi:uncharacterized protein YeaO (DUF488 family)
VTPETKGLRILVDRLWPRGIRKDALEPFVWARQTAPSDSLRKWFGHDPERFAGFAERYEKELDDNPYARTFANQVREALIDQDVVLMYAAKDREHNQAVVLKAWLDKKSGI